MTGQVFLSHSGVDSEAARALKQRLEAQGLAVWYDKDDLRAGEPWQTQLEEAIRDSAAFVVYVGSRGVVNWVKMEVGLALDRAVAEDDYRFVPVVSAKAVFKFLPGLLRQFQCVFDVEARSEEFEKLIAALGGGDEAGRILPEERPFFALEAISEARSHLFFGREQETRELVELVHQTPLVMVTGDSGSGKSSLVRAGLVPEFRGGSLAALDGERPEDEIWHVVVTRPRGAPWRELGDAVDMAARPLGLPIEDRDALSTMAASGDADRVRRALRCGLPAEQTRVLVVVDQFEELLTVTRPENRDGFVQLLLGLADSSDPRFRVVLTMRHDYVNLCPQELRVRLDEHDRRARFLLGRMSDKGLRRCVTEPLCLARVPEADREALARSVLRDVGQRPGDLALVQMALTETWDARELHGGNLLRAYGAVGRVEGALAEAAEQVFRNLTREQRQQFEVLLVRLVRLGDTGGATRRTAHREEFDDEVWNLAQWLAGKDGKRLLLLGGTEERPTVEIAHEALVVSWPRLQELLQTLTEDIRILHGLMPRADAWAEDEEGKTVATGADLETFARLASDRRSWLSDRERSFVEASSASVEGRRRRDRLMRQAIALFAVLMSVSALTAVLLYSRAREERDRALLHQSRYLVGLGKEALNEKRADRAARFALAALPEDLGSPDRPILTEAYALLRSALLQDPLNVLGRQEGWVRSLAVLPDGRVVSGASRDRLVIWDPVSGGEGDELGLPGQFVTSVAVLEDGRVVNGGTSGANGGIGGIYVWDPRDSGKEMVLGDPEENINALAILGDGRVLSGAEDGGIRLWRLDEPGVPLDLGDHGAEVRSVAALAENRIVSSADDGRILLWDPARLKDGAVELGKLDGGVRVVATVGDRVVAGGNDGSLLLWDLGEGGDTPVEIYGKDSGIRALVVLSDGRLASGDRLGRIRLWNLVERAKPIELGRHSSTVHAITELPDQRLVTGDEGGILRLWKSEPSVEPWEIAWLSRRVIRAVAVVSEHGLVSIDDADRLVYWDLETPGRGVLLGKPENPVVLLAALGDGRFVAGDVAGRVSLWTTEASEAPVLLGSHASALPDMDRVVRDIVVLHGRRVVSGAGDGCLRIWEPEDQGAALKHGCLDWPVAALVVLPDGRIVSGDGDGRLHLWQVDLQEPPEELGYVNVLVTSLAVLPSGFVVSGDAAGRVRLWDPDHPGEPVELGVLEGAVGDVAVLPDGRVATLDHPSSRIQIWDPNAPGVVVDLAQLDTARSLIAMEDGRLLTTQRFEAGARILVLDPAQLLDPAALVEQVRERLLRTELTNGEKELAGFE